MTLINWLAITALASAIVLIHGRSNKQADRREDDPPDRGGVPMWVPAAGEAEEESLSGKSLCCGADWTDPPAGYSHKAQYPPGMHYAPTEPIVPKRRKPRIKGHGIGSITLSAHNETYIIVYRNGTDICDLLDLVRKWKNDKSLSFDDMCEARIMDWVFSGGKGVS